MKLVFIYAFLFVAAVFAADGKQEEERPRVYKRVIPADVLRGKFQTLEI